MAAIRQERTTPEIAVARALRRLGVRFSTQNRNLPGSPDIVNRAQGWAIYVHGCFWHRHSGCVRTTTPRNNRRLWEEKFEQNVRRDERKARQLRRQGYGVVTVWECQTENEDALRELLTRRLTRMGGLEVLARTSPEQQRRRQARRGQASKGKH